jgi:hypothetical protein
MKNDLIFVFDLDKTLGYFTQIAIFKEAIEAYIKRTLKKKEFFELLDIYPEIFRPDIYVVMNYLKKLKLKHKDIKVMIYTNNIGPKSWTYVLKEYIEMKINHKIFDTVITAWKVADKTYEKCRTTHDKTIDDLRKCGNIPKQSKIIFFDDNRHPKMIHNDIKYIFLYSYHNDILFEKMIERFISSNKKLVKKVVKNKQQFGDFVMGFSQNDPLGYRYIESNFVDLKKFNKTYVLYKIKEFINDNLIKQITKTKKERLRNIKKGLNKMRNKKNKTRKIKNKKNKIRNKKNKMRNKKNKIRKKSKTIKKSKTPQFNRVLISS